MNNIKQKNLINFIEYIILLINYISKVLIYFPYKVGSELGHVVNYLIYKNN